MTWMSMQTLSLGGAIAASVLALVFLILTLTRDSFIGRFLSLLAFLVCGTAALAGGATYQLGGPAWPTGPEARPLGVAMSDRLTVPFEVNNDSKLFPILVDEIRCSLVELESDPDLRLSGSTSQVDLKAGWPDRLGCEFPLARKIQITSMRLRIYVNYRLALIPYGVRVYASDPFRWIGGQWIYEGSSRAEPVSPTPPPRRL